jgi:hypothetical protein
MKFTLSTAAEAHVHCSILIHKLSLLLSERRKFTHEEEKENYFSNIFHVLLINHSFSPTGKSNFFVAHSLLTRDGNQLFLPARL